MRSYEVIVSGYGDTEQGTIKGYVLNEDGQFGESYVMRGYDNPSFLCAVEDKLFVIEETEGETRITSTYNTRGETIVWDQITLQGSDGCYLAYSKKWHVVLGACYGSGHVFAIGIDAENKFSELSRMHQGQGEDGVSRAHCMSVGPLEYHGYGVNIGLDRVYCYKLSEKGLEVNTAFPYLQLPVGEGPRHMVWHPSLPVAYIITEYSNKIWVVAQNASDGSLRCMQSIDLILDQAVTTYGATVCITSDGQTLYAANRGKDTITHMAIGEDGTLTYVGEYTAYGCWPRHISLAPDDQYLAIANQKSDQVSVVEILAGNRTLGKILHELPVAGASFVEIR